MVKNSEIVSPLHNEWQQTFCLSSCNILGLSGVGRTKIVNKCAPYERICLLIDHYNRNITQAIKHSKVSCPLYVMSDKCLNRDCFHSVLFHYFSKMYMYLEEVKCCYLT